MQLRNELIEHKSFLAQKYFQMTVITVREI